MAVHMKTHIHTHGHTDTHRDAMYTHTWCGTNTPHTQTLTHTSRCSAQSTDALCTFLPVRMVWCDDDATRSPALGTCTDACFKFESVCVCACGWVTSAVVVRFRVHYSLVLAPVHVIVVYQSTELLCHPLGRHLEPARRQTRARSAEVFTQGHGVSLLQSRSMTPLNSHGPREIRDVRFDVTSHRAKGLRKGRTYPRRRGVHSAMSSSAITYNFKAIPPVRPQPHASQCL